MSTVDESRLKDAPVTRSQIGAQPLNSSSRGKQAGRRRIFWLQLTAFLLGLALFFFVVRQVGVQLISDALFRVGGGFLWVLLCGGLRHVFRTAAMCVAVPAEHRRFRFRQVFGARLGGEAISFLTFTGPLLGEATKAALLRKRLPLAYGVPALVIDNLLYNLSVALFVFSGACVMLVAYPLPPFVTYLLIGIAVVAVCSLLAVGLAVSRRLMPLSMLLSQLARLGLNRRTVVSRRKQVRRLEAHVYDFYRTRRRSFLAMLGLNFLAHLSSVTEVYVILRLLGLDPPAQAAYAIESLTKIINLVFGFVPATIGVYEGGTELILRTMGFAAAIGVTLALVRKAGLVFWTGAGLLILIRRAVPSMFRRLAERHPRWQKMIDNLVISNVLHRPARTAASVFGVAIGVLLIVFTVGLAHGVLRERGRREGNINAQIMLRASGSLGLTGSQHFTLPISRLEEVAKIEGVRAVAALGQNLISSDSGFGSRMVEGVEFQDYARLTGINMVEGRGLQGGDEVIVDTVWQEQRRVPINSEIEIYGRPFRVVGVYAPPGGGRLKIPLATMQEQLGGEGHCSSVLVACQDPAQQETVAANIRRVLPDDQIIFTRDLPELYASSLPALNIFINVVVTIAAVISVMVILLAMYTSVMERTRQIGILKSLGMSNASIAWIIQQEAILVSVLGVLLGVLLTLAVRAIMMRTTTLTIEIEPRWIAISLAIGLAGGTVGALYPALRAARQDAVKALNYE